MTTRTPPSHRPLAESAAEMVRADLAALGFDPALVEDAAADVAAGCATIDAQAWEAFAEWCDDHGHDDLPAEPAVVAAYLAGLRAADRDLAVGAIAERHNAAGHPDPTPATADAGPVR